MKNVIRIVLGIAIVVLAYFIYESIMEPVRFEKQKSYRYGIIIQKLKDIREIEKFYKAANNKYTGSFDTLISFAFSDSIPVVKMIPDPMIPLLREPSLKLSVTPRCTIPCLVNVRISRLMNSR